MAEFFMGMGATRRIGIGIGRGRGSCAIVGKPIIIQFTTPQRFIGFLTISGQTRDSGGSPLANCFVELELSSDGTRIATTTSDGSGNYSFQVGNPATYQITAYKAGSPDVAGITVNTLVGS